MIRVATLKRISTKKQDLENQEQSLTKQIEVFGWNRVRDYQEIISGTKSRDSRPQLQNLMNDARRGVMDYVMVYELSRLGRSTVEVINVLHELESCGVYVFVIKNAIDTRTPQGKMFSQMVSIFSQLEIDLMKSRQANAISVARKKQSKWGKGKLISNETREEISNLREQGVSIRQIASQLSISKGSVQHFLKTTQVH